MIINHNEIQTWKLKEQELKKDRINLPWLMESKKIKLIQMNKYIIKM